MKSLYEAHEAELLKDRKELDVTGLDEEQAKDGTYLRKERSSCSYQQQMYVGDVDTDHMEASYENGILTLKMPKKQPVVPESRQITIQ